MPEVRSVAINEELTTLDAKIENRVPT